jgi:proton-coupled amino acid transporter
MANKKEDVPHRRLYKGVSAAAGDNDGIELPSLQRPQANRSDDEMDDDDSDEDSSLELDPLVGQPGSGNNVSSSKKKIGPLALQQGADDHHGVAAPGTASTPQVIINIIISFVGAGLLGVPNAFRQCGWLLGGITLLSVSAINIYAMLSLPRVQTALQKIHPNEILQSYCDLGRHLLGPHGERIVQVCLGISQAGFATAYIIFIAANLYSIAQVNRLLVCAACIPGLVALVQYRDLKSLSPFSLLANTANFCALSSVLFQDYESYEPHNDTIHMVQFGGFLYIIAITIYSMEGIGLVLSLNASCQQQSRFPWLLSVTLACISCFMVVFGTAGYVAFGDLTLAPITLNLTSHWSSTFVKLALCLGLYLTYPIMMFPIWNIWENEHTTATRRIALRTGVVVCSAMVAFAVPNFGKFLSLVGSSICTLLGFVFPCYFHLKVLGSELSWWEWVLNVVILVGGALFGLMGTFQSVKAMLDGDDFVEGVRW